METVSYSTIPGLRHLEEFLTAAEHNALLSAVDAQPWSDGMRRRVQHFGYHYDYKRRSVDRTLALGPLPDWAGGLATRLAQEDLMPARPDQLIVNEYTPGQGIASHVDCEPCFGEVICSLSLGSACVMVLTHTADGRREQVLLRPRSLLVLSGEARHAWRHGIPARLSDKVEGKILPRSRRVSLTFRTVILSDPDSDSKKV